MIKMSGYDLVQRLLVDDEILTQMVWETPLSLIGLLLWLALGTDGPSIDWRRFLCLDATTFYTVPLDQESQNRSHRRPFAGQGDLSVQRQYCKNLCLFVSHFPIELNLW